MGNIPEANLLVDIVRMFVQFCPLSVHLLTLCFHEQAETFSTLAWGRHLTLEIVRYHCILQLLLAWNLLPYGDIIS